jgi:O-antigen/teichoic acid export membrane protein
MTVSAKSIKKAAVQGAAWNYATFIGSKGLVFVTTVILARLLSPEDFGLLALGMIAINYLDTIDNLGVADAMVYRQNDPERAYNVAFVINLLTGVLAATIGILIAPLVALFFDEPRITPVLQALSLTFVISGIGHLLESRFRRELDFRSKFFVQVGKAIVKGGVSITLALTGFGVWSLVWGQIAGVFAGTFLYWFRSHWIPKFLMDFEIARSLFAYGSQMILVEILGMVHKNIDYLIVGYLIGTEQLGFYTMAFRLPELIIINICYIFGQTLFPAFAKMQNQMDDLRAGYMKTIQYLSLITIPAGLLMFLIAPEFVTFFYGEKWQASIAIVQVLSIYALIYSLSYNAGDIYKATGRPVILNQLSVVKLAITIPALWFAAPYGILYVAIAQVFTTVILTTVRLAVARRIIGFGWDDVWQSLRPAAVSALIMFAFTFVLRTQLLNLHPLINMIIVGMFGLVLYTSILWLTERALVGQVLRTVTTSVSRSRSSKTESSP